MILYIIKSVGEFLRGFQPRLAAIKGRKMSPRNFGFRRIVPADDFSPYEPDVRWPFYLIGAVTLMLVGLGVFIA